jgi:hypothetical protein
MVTAEAGSLLPKSSTSAAAEVPTSSQWPRAAASAAAPSSAHRACHASPPAYLVTKRGRQRRTDRRPRRRCFGLGLGAAPDCCRVYWKILAKIHSGPTTTHVSIFFG